MSSDGSRQRTIQNNVVECYEIKRHVGHQKRRRQQQHKRLNQRPPRLIGIISVTLLVIVAFAVVQIIIVPTTTIQRKKDDGLLSSTLRRNLNIEHASSITPHGNVKEEKLHAMSMDEYEQSVLAGASELNWFPQSIGKDTIDETTNDDDWEMIEHPAAEVIRVFHTGNNNMKQSSLLHKLNKKTVTVKEIANVLARKNKRVVNEEELEKKSDSNDNNNDGFMRVPKFWDPLPFRNIANERQRRQLQNGGVSGSSSSSSSASFNDTTTDSSSSSASGVRRYLGNYGSRLMTPLEAKSIGSRISNKNGVTSGEDENDLLDTIFVAISSYRDWQCSRTVESIFSRATHPERIRVGVVDQIRLDVDTPCSIPPLGSCNEYPEQITCHYRHQIDYLSVDAALSVGPVFARHLGHRLYRGEYFAIQSDAHVDYVLGWDVDIINQWRSAKNEMAILTAYLSGIEDHMNITTGERTSSSRPIMCMSDFEGGEGGRHLRHGQQPEGVPYIHDMPTIEPFWAAGFSFGRGHFVVNVPYDQHLPWIFQGEEISIGLRGFTYGYDYYTPERQACYHYYGRTNVPLFWENTAVYQGTSTYGMNRLNAIIRMAAKPTNDWIRTDEVKYGIGKVRELQTFFDVFGIHVREQRVERHLCKFVGQPMQREFIPHLRSNGMGIDYTTLKYRFVDQWPNEKD